MSELKDDSAESNEDSKKKSKDPAIADNQVSPLLFRLL
jgi:hypothetical protein